jgi:hypothetical protein
MTAPARQGPSLLSPGIGPADVLPGWARLQWWWPPIHANESATLLIVGCFRFLTLIQFLRNRHRDDCLASGINSANLEDRLSDVETDCRDYLQGQLH